ncbi:MAG TPA: hypothetical protein VNU23_11470 [Candidatus Cybelea sp.]|nr:hypothetical protein [Candidatus Cybelea sp.]
MLPRRESLPAVTAAAVVAISLGAIGVLGGLLIELSMLLMPEVQTAAGRPAIPPGTRTMVGMVWLFLIAVAVFGIFVGVGIVRRRSWARISILVWGGIMAVVSLIAIPVLFFIFSAMPGMMPNQADAAPLISVMKWISVLFYGIPLGVGIWWLVLFTRPRIAAAFSRPAGLTPYTPTMDVSGFPLPQPTATASRSRKPACPLPLMILAGFLIFSAFSMVLFVLVPVPGAMPFFFFGHFYSGLTAKVILGLLGLLFGAAGVGMFKLKPWALDTILVLQCVFLINGIMSVRNPRFLVVMQEAMERADAENSAFAGGNLFLTGSFFQAIMIFSLIFSAALIALLIFYRSRFLEAASAAKT